jgi:hypothetical protein
MTRGGSVVIGRHYTAEGAQYPRSFSVSMDVDEGVAGVTDPILVEPIDYEAEIARRAATREPLPVVETDLSNTLFGV